MIFLEIANHTHPIWHNVFFYLFVSVFILATMGIMTIVGALKRKNKNSELIEHQHVARIDNIRKENEEKLENIRVEMLKREEERSRQWMESEKETLHVLNGVSNLLDLNDRFDKSRLDDISEVVNEINNKIENLKQK